MIRILREEIQALDFSRRSLRFFGWLVGGVLLVIAAALLFSRDWSGDWAIYILSTVGAALLSLGFVAPTVLKPVYLVWMTLAVVLGFIMTRIILTIVFFFVVTPIGLALRMMGRDPLNRKPDPTVDTYWIEKTYPDESRARLKKYY